MFKIFPEIFFRRSCSETGLFLQTGFLWLQETGVRLLRISRRKTTGRIEINMKKKTEKRIRCGRLAGALFVLGVLAIAVCGSFAAYTNFDSVKRVVSTGTRSDTMFGSNYLSLLNRNDTSYPVKRISLAESGNDYAIMILVCNHVWGDDSLYNPKSITYQITAQLISADGGALPENCTDITVNSKPFGADGTWTDESSLPSGGAQQSKYQIRIPKELKDKIKIQITVEPSTEASVAAVDSKKLAAILSFADYAVNKNWTGHFTDSRADNRTPDDYDAFNYELFGNGSGTVTVTWDDSLLPGAWAADAGQANSHSYSFTAGESTTAIQLQFYRNPEAAEQLKDRTWEQLETLVQVTYKE